jgi:dihydroneopterin aldolase
MIATTGLKGLRIDCGVGVYPYEREQPQPIVMNIELDYDVAVAASSDEVADAVDYERVAERVAELVGRRQFHLIEAMAEETADILLGRYASVQNVRLEVSKPNTMAAADCSFVRLERARR